MIILYVWVWPTGDDDDENGNEMLLHNLFIEYRNHVHCSHLPSIGVGGGPAALINFKDLFTLGSGSQVRVIKNSFIKPFIVFSLQPFSIVFSLDFHLYLFKWTNKTRNRLSFNLNR